MREDLQKTFLGPPNERESDSLNKKETIIVPFIPTSASDFSFAHLTLPPILLNLKEKVQKIDLKCT